MSKKADSSSCRNALLRGLQGGLQDLVHTLLKKGDLGELEPVSLLLWFCSRQPGDEPHKAVTPRKTACGRVDVS